MIPLLDSSQPSRSFLARAAVPLAAACIFLAAFAGHMRALRHYYVLDDFTLITANRFIADSANARIILNPRYLVQPSPIRCGARPLTVLSLMLDYRFWKLNPFGYHLMNLVLHGINALLVFSLALCLQRRWGRETGRAAAVLTATIAALFFALHPAQAEAVNIASFRADLLVCLFYLLSLTGFLCAGEHRGLRKAGSLTAAVTCFVLGIFSKEIAFTIPFVIASVYLYGAGFSRRRMILLAILAVLSLLFLKFFWSPRFVYPLHFALFPTIRDGATPLGSVPLYINTVLLSVLHYAGTVLFPAHLSVDYSIALPHTVISLRGLAAVLVLGAIAVFSRIKKDPIFRFGLVLAAITYVPVSNIIPLVNTVSDRYLYLPLTGLSIAAARLLYGFPAAPGWRSTIRHVLPLLLVLLCLGLTLRRNPVFQDNLALYRDAVRVAPDNPRVRFNLGMAYLAEGNYAAAIEELQRVKQLSPLYRRCDVLQMTGFACEKNGDARTAHRLYREHLYILRQNAGLR